VKLKSLFRHPAFWGVLLLKLISSAMFQSRFISELFIPFVRYFVESGFSNPWSEFYRRGVLDAFPYSSVMLGLLAFPYWIGSLLVGGASHLPQAAELVLLRVPLLGADIAICVILCRWFETRWKSVLWLYWCSPILFYISYVHGQIDAIPTAFLLGSLWFAVRVSPVQTGLLLAAGIASKFHLAAAAPLIGFFLYKRVGSGQQWRTVLVYTATLAAGIAVLIGPLLMNEAYRVMVLGAKESQWVLSLAWKMPTDVKVLLCPAVIVALILHFFSYRRITKDVLILYIGLVYSVLILLVPVMPGWAYWSLPFLCYFLIRQEEMRYAPFWFYTVSYLLYFCVFASSSALLPIDRWLTEPTRELGRNLAFTVMQASLGLVALWVYRVGVRSYAAYRRFRRPFAIGIAGDSASGKHTLAESIAQLTGVENTVRLHGDDYHRWPRGHEAWKEQTHLNPSSNYFRQPVEHINELKLGVTIEKSTYDHNTGQFTNPEPVEPRRVILFEGLHPFVFQRMRDAFEIKVFLDTDEALRRYWKVSRDTAQRGYTPDKVNEEIQRRLEDSERYVRPQSKFANWVIRYRAAGELPTPAAGMPDVPLAARHIVSSSVVEIEDLVNELNKRRDAGLHVEWTMEPDLMWQEMEVQGKLSVADVQEIADRIFPDGEEFIAAHPQWRPDLEGVNQLVFLALLHSILNK
jgi:uridine kinase